MKKLIIGSMLLIFVILVCSSPSKKELFKITDKFVTLLETSHKSYGIAGGLKHSRKTTDGLYVITPVGRLINVKILKVVDGEEYERLRKSLERHYKPDNRVKRVFINSLGTIMIDCRN